MSAAFLRSCVALNVACFAVPTAADVATDGTAGPRVRLDGDLEIGAELGTRAGRNLFHSFERFSLDTGERATFSGPDEIRRVISRVTGGARSDIDGTIASTIPGADFYFLNPAGVVFGPNALLDIQGSFHVSTADELRFADGAAFSAADPTASSFTVAAPEAFGFLGAAPASIAVEESFLQVPSGEALSIVGGDIDIVGGPEGFILAEAGQITLAALGGPGQARPDSGEVSAESAADIRLTDQAFIASSGDGGGAIRIRGGRLVVEQDSVVFADNTGPTAATAGLDVRAAAVEVTGGSELTADVLNAGSGGAVTITADRLTIREEGAIASDTFDQGDAGAVTVSVDELLIDRADAAGFTGISSGTANVGNAGEVRLAADRLRLANGGAINTDAEAGSAGRAGSITVVTTDLLIDSGSEISSDTSGTGAAGTVTVRADQLVIDGANARFFTGISSDAEAGSTGDAGAINVRAGTLTILDESEIRSLTFGEGDAGRVTVKADDLVIDGGGRVDFTGISSDAGNGSPGNAGAVNVIAGTLTILDDGAIASSTFDRGDAGTVTVEAGRLLIDGAGGSGFTGIASRANAGDGDAGKVTVKADDLVIDGGGRVDGALISGATLADGDAGSVDVTATTLTIRGGGGIGSSTFGNGDGGEVKVEADELTIDGDGVSGFTGISGNINGGLAGDAGEITVVADRLTIRNDGEIISNAFFGSGDAGTIVVRAGQLVIDGANAPGFTGISTGTQTTGDAGTVTVEADRLVIDGANAAIDSDTEAGSTGNAGAISVSADTVEIAGGSQVASSANGRGTAGDVVVGAADRLSVDRGSITTESAFGGGGEIRLLVGDVIDLRDSAVTTSVAGGADPTAGNITIDPTILIIDGSRIQANAPAGSGGTVTIVADNILVPGGDFQALLDRKDISATGGDPTRAGTIAVSAPEVDLSGGLVVVEGAFIDTAPLRERCGSRRDIGVSSFTGVGRGGLPPSPDGPLAGAYASGLGEPGVALLLEERDEELFAEEHSVERAIGPVLAGLVPCHGAL